MPLTVIVGGQYGSEGKGKITGYLSQRDNVDIVVRCGGPNSGHTVEYGGQRYELRMLPAGFINPNSRLLLAAGSFINPDILFTEIKVAGVDPKRVGIDKNAGIINTHYLEDETCLGLRDRLGSTLSGTGKAVASRALRVPDFLLAKDVPALEPFITDVSTEVNAALDKGARVIIEGTQGFGLSVYHSPHYPYATSRDTTASGFLSEVGVSPRLVTDIVMAVRTYPIRVAGNSGPLPDEIAWEEVRKRSGCPHPIFEFTTTTKMVRRVALFHLDIVKFAASVNRPTHVFLHGTDYISWSNKASRDFDDLTLQTKTFIVNLEHSIVGSISLIGIGPENHELIDIRQ